MDDPSQRQLEWWEKITDTKIEYVECGDPAEAEPIRRAIQSVRGGISLAAVSVAAAWMILVISGSLPARPLPPELRLFHFTQDAGERSLILLWIGLIGPLAEELIFRVLMQGRLLPPLCGRWAWIVAATAFVACHPYRDMLPLLPLSLLLSWPYERSRDLLCVTVAHGLFNLSFLALSLL